MILKSDKAVLRERRKNMMQCSLCKEFFNPASLREVFEHQHIPELVLDKDYFGKEVKPMTPQKQVR